MESCARSRLLISNISSFKDIIVDISVDLYYNFYFCIEFYHEHVNTEFYL